VTLKEAAKIVGCSPQHLRYLIRTGKAKATTKAGGPKNFVWYEMTEREARRLRDNPPKARGVPRGSKKS